MQSPLRFLDKASHDTEKRVKPVCRLNKASFNFVHSSRSIVRRVGRAQYYMYFRRDILQHKVHRHRTRLKVKALSVVKAKEAIMGAFVAAMLHFVCFCVFYMLSR